MTIKDIARESGYAVGTVSRVLNNNPAVIGIIDKLHMVSSFNLSF